MTPDTDRTPDGSRAAARLDEVTWTRETLARTVDHTLLKPEATDEQVAALCAEAVELGAFSVCVSPSRLPVSLPDAIAVCTVVGFPSGAHDSEIKAAETALAIRDGATEIDMVVDLGSVTASAASAALTSLSWAPDGKPTTVQTTRPSATATGSRLGDTQIEKAPSSAASAASASTWADVASGLSRVWSTVRASVSRVQVTPASLVAGRGPR